VARSLHIYSMSQSIDIVIFGGTGDLSQRKLLPALFQLHRLDMANNVIKIIATGRGPLQEDKFKDSVKEKLQLFLHHKHWSEDVWKIFSSKLQYQMVEANVSDHYSELQNKISVTQADIQLFYLATLPSLYGQICQLLQESGAVNANSRVVLEKPIGNDLSSCHKINDQVSKVFPEEACFRIDHYLGKETVQNLLAVRFGNPLFRPVWNNQWIDNIQITVAESIGVGERAEYFLKVGALRDMVQNHLLQVLSLVAMEPPATLDPNDLRDEKVKVLRGLRKIDKNSVNEHTVRGYYATGAVDEKVVPGFLDELGSKKSVNTETFVAIRAEVDNWRWAGVPFYLRTGKRLRSRHSEIVIEFKRQPFFLFPNTNSELTNKLVIHLQPEENIVLHTLNKKPGLTERLRLHSVELQLTDDDPDPDDNYDAYERLLLDAINGDQALFMRRDEVETAWKWIDTIIEAWNETDMQIQPYNAGTMGPSRATAMIVRDGRNWYE